MLPFEDVDQWVDIQMTLSRSTILMTQTLPLKSRFVRFVILFSRASIHVGQKCCEIKEKGGLQLTINSVENSKGMNACKAVLFDMS